MSLRTHIEPGQLAKLLAKASREAQRKQKPVVAGMRRQIPLVDFLPLFAAAQNEDRFFGEHPDRAQALFAVGCATYLEANGPNRFVDCAKARAELFRNAQFDGFGEAAEERPLLLGGFSFNDAEPSLESAWAGFPAARLVLPQLLLTHHPQAGTDPSRAALSLFAWITPHSDLDFELAQLTNRLVWLEAQFDCSDTSARDLAVPHAPNPDLHAIEAPEEVYLEAARAALDEITSGALEKVVLARSCTVETPSSFDAARVLHNLRENYPSCFIFAASRYGISFLGATPERLLALRGGEIQSEPLAGSMRRGETPGQDRQLAQQLRESKKEQAEHAVVVRAIREALEPFCVELQVSESPSVLVLPGIQHLKSTLRGKLRASAAHSILEILGTLHPTPAVAGTPREQALAWLKDNEGFERGWYTGPVGWVNDRGEGDFAIALRAALLRGNHAHLHAGAGLVAGSLPEAELAETRLKMRAALSAILELDV